MHNKLSPIVFVNSTENQDVYMEILQESFVPFIEALNADGHKDLEFQQDNARPHTAKRTKELLENIAEKYELKIMDWLANSPDLNPIEHLWAHIKLKLYQ